MSIKHTSKQCKNSEIGNLDLSTKSVISILAPTVKTILEVGSFNSEQREIPLGYRILLLEDEMTKCIKEPKSLSNITKLPFKKNSSDLIIVREELARLNKRDLIKSILELIRISRQYISIQVPHFENLSYSQFFCEKCNVITHQRGHCRSFAISDLIELLGKYGWNPQVVNLSGKVTESNYYPNLSDVNFDLFNYRQDGPLCSSCESCDFPLEKKILDKEYYLKRITESEIRFSPWFEELTVLFSKDNFDMKKPTVTKLPEPVLIKSSDIDFTAHFEKRSFLSMFETVPYTVFDTCQVEQHEKGVTLSTNQDKKIVMHCCFSSSVVNTVEVLVEGTVEGETEIQCSQLDIHFNKNEGQIKKIKNKKFSERFYFTQNERIAYFCITYISKVRAVTINSVKIFSDSKESDSSYLYRISGSDAKRHLEFMENKKTLWNFCLPEERTQFPLWNFEISGYIEKLKQLTTSNPEDASLVIKVNKFEYEGLLTKTTLRQKVISLAIYLVLKTYEITPKTIKHIFAKLFRKIQYQRIHAKKSKYNIYSVIIAIYTKLPNNRKLQLKIFLEKIKNKIGISPLDVFEADVDAFEADEILSNYSIIESPLLGLTKKIWVYLK